MRIGIHLICGIVYTDRVYDIRSMSTQRDDSKKTCVPLPIYISLHGTRKLGAEIIRTSIWVKTYFLNFDMYVKNNCPTCLRYMFMQYAKVFHQKHASVYFKGTV